MKRKKIVIFGLTVSSSLGSGFDAKRMTDAYLRLYDAVRCAASSR